MQKGRVVIRLHKNTGKINIEGVREDDNSIIKTIYSMSWKYCKEANF